MTLRIPSHSFRSKSTTAVYMRFKKSAQRLDFPPRPPGPAV